MSTIIIAIILFWARLSRISPLSQGEKDPAETASVPVPSKTRCINRIGISKEWVCTRNPEGKNHWSIEPMVLFYHYSLNRIHIQLMR